MWLLVAKSTCLRSPYLLSSHTYRIGRNTDLDIVLYGDKTISRLHAEIHIQARETSATQLNEDSSEDIILTDHSSSGTYVNSIRINGYARIKEGDSIRFGVLETYFELVKEPLIITCSYIQDETRLLKNLSRICGRLRDEYTDDVTLIVSDRLELSGKTLSALLDDKPLITSKYLDALIESSEKKVQAPSLINYRPKSFDKQLEKLFFFRNESRKQVLKGIVFVFEMKFFMDSMRRVIHAAGGQCKLASSVANREENQFLVRNEYDEEKIYEAIVKCDFKSNEFFSFKTKIEIPDTLVDDTLIQETPEKVYSDETQPAAPSPRVLFKELTTHFNQTTPLKRKYTQMDFTNEQVSPKQKEIKIESKVKKTKMNSGQISCTIYSKDKPPPSTLLSTREDDALIIKLNSQLNISIVPLKMRKIKHENTTFELTNHQTNERKNFKKFRKIEKLNVTKTKSLLSFKGTTSNKQKYECKPFFEPNDENSIHMSFLKFIKNTQ